MGYVKWNEKLRRYIVRQVEAGITPISEIARNRRVPRRTIYYLLEKFKQGGFGSLEPKQRGRKKEPLNERFNALIAEEFFHLKCGSHKIWLRFGKNGYVFARERAIRIY
jgi:transposase